MRLSLKPGSALPARSSSGFTLIELLATIGIITVLAVCGTGFAQKCIQKAKMAKELSAGRALINAYQAYASENDGNFMAAMDMTINSVYFEPTKRNVTGHPAQRYPYRLAPYFDYRMEGVIQVNQDRSKTKGEYLTSTFPAFGINYYLVGGLWTQASTPGGLTRTVQFPTECVTRMSQSGQVLAFATGGTGQDGNYINGFNILTPPNTTERTWSWSAWKKGEDPGNHGNVDARFDGKAIAVFLDGSVQLKSIEELDDMRLWSRNAAELNDRSYKLSFY